MEISMSHVPCSTFLYRGDNPNRELYRVLTVELDDHTEDELDSMRFTGEVIMVPVLFSTAIKDMGLLRELYNDDIQLLKADIQAGLFSVWEAKEERKIESEFDLVLFGYPADHKQAIK
jgi:hypothetical protein